MYTLVRLYLLTSDIFDKLRQRHSTIRTWDSDTRIGIISLATESKRIVCNLPFENQLFGYIHYCTEISEININLLPNTCNFHRKFWFIFSLHLSENAQNVHFREARFQSFPDPPQRTSAFGARYYFCRTNSELLPPGLLFPIGNTQYNITYSHSPNASKYFCELCFPTGN